MSDQANQAGEPLNTMRGKGRELCDLLRKELNVPKRATGFSVHFETNDVVRVECAYIPEQQDGSAPS